MLDFNGGASQPYPQLFCSSPKVIDCITFSNNEPYENANLLHEKYVVQGLSTLQIAKEFFCSKGTIRSALIRAGIPVRKRQEKGRSSNPRYGSRPVKGHPTENLAELRVIKTIIEMRNDGLSFKKIGEFLTSVGVPTKTRRKKWHHEVIRQIYLANIDSQNGEKLNNIEESDKISEPAEEALPSIGSMASETAKKPIITKTRNKSPSRKIVGGLNVR